MAILVAAIFFAIVGGLCVQYVIKHWAKVTVPIWAACLIGVFLEWIPIVAAVATYAITVLGKPIPTQE